MSETLCNAEAVGGGVLIPEGHRDDSEEAEAQSFVVPVANGIQLETRRRTRRQPAPDSVAAEEVSISVRHSLSYWCSFYLQ